MPAKTEDSAMNKEGKKKRSKFFTISMIVLDVIIIIAAFGAVFYFIVYNNIGGVTERYYSSIKTIPFLRLALPEPPDPLNPKYMTQDEIREKYLEFKDEVEILKQQLAQANARADELSIYREDYDRLIQEAGAKLQELNEREAAVAEKEKQVEELKKQLDKSIANSDRKAFIEYFESIDPENAASIYESVILEQQTDENVKKFAQVYAEMDADSAASIFEQMGTSKLDMIAETLKAMNRKKAAEIIQEMSPDFAARVTEKLNELYKGG